MTFYEGHGYLLVHDSTGRHTALDRKPEIAPGGARLATANSDLWAQFDANRIAISRVAGDTVVAEWQVTPTSWGPSNPHWVGDDTIRFTQEWSTTQPDSFIVRTAFLVRSPRRGNWWSPLVRRRVHTVRGPCRTPSPPAHRFHPRRRPWIAAGGWTTVRPHRVRASRFPSIVSARLRGTRRSATSGGTFQNRSSP
jgi:hypothetical protein